MLRQPQNSSMHLRRRVSKCSPRKQPWLRALLGCARSCSFRHGRSWGRRGLPTCITSGSLLTPVHLTASRNASDSLHLNMHGVGPCRMPNAFQTKRSVHASILQHLMAGSRRKPAPKPCWNSLRCAAAEAPWHLAARHCTCNSTAFLAGPVKPPLIGVALAEPRLEWPRAIFHRQQRQPLAKGRHQQQKAGQGLDKILICLGPSRTRPGAVAHLRRVH